MSLRSFLLTLILFSQFCVHAQNWQSVGGPYISASYSVRYMYTDTISDQLLCSASVLPYQRLLKYSSTNGWDTLGSLIGSGTLQVTNYLGNFYSVSCAAPAGPNTSVGILVGNQWQLFAETRQNAFAFYQHDSDLYAMGTFDSIGGIQAPQVARYDGTNWNRIGTASFGGGSAVTCAIHYQGNLYIGGGFHDTVGNCLAKWDGQNWTGFGNFFGGGFDAVNCMTVYNGELYVGGYFTTAGGSPGNFIARYDGTTWTQVGGGLAGGQVWDMQVYNGELWVCGQISAAGGIPVVGIAKYDGLDWCNVGNFDNMTESIEVYHGELYIGGGFWTVDGDSVTSKVLKWIGGSNTNACGHLNTGVEESRSDISVTVFPNPSNDITTFQFSESQNRTLIIRDNLGREVWRKQTDEVTVEFPAGQYADGLYFYVISEDNLLFKSGCISIAH